VNKQLLQESLAVLGYVDDSLLAAYRTCCYDYAVSANVSLDDNIEDDNISEEMFGFICDQASLVRSQQGIHTVAAWAGGPSIRHPAPSVEFALEHNINRLVVICDDHSAHRDPTVYQLRPEGADAIVKLCRAAKDVGIDVGLMWWPMPHKEYLKTAAETLLPLAERCGADRLEADAEEPWTKARQRMPYPEAAGLIGDLLGGRILLGANGIGYTPVGAFAPLAEICDYVTLQGYMTSTQPVQDAPAKFAKRWHGHFHIQKLVMGLAAYRQSGIPGFSPTTAMRHSLESALAAGVNEVCYWWLQSIMASAEVARVVKGIRT
jgi:hypothetical protein